MRFTYEAYDRSGEQQSGEFDAPTSAAARQHLEGRGLFVASLRSPDEERPAGPSDPAAPSVQRERSGGAHRKQVAGFTRELSVLVGAGVPLTDGITALEKQSSPEEWRSVVRAVRVDLESGQSLREAIGRQPRHFSRVYRSLVAAGEESGELAVMLERLAHLLQREISARSSVIGAMIYPLVLIVLSLTAMIVMLLLVVPRFEVMFDSLNAPVPATTQMLMAASEFVRGYWWAILGGLAAVGTGIGVFSATARGTAYLDRLVLRVPGIGTLIRGMAEARLARLLSTLLGASVPLLDAMELAASSVNSSVYRLMFERARDAVATGVGLAPVLEQAGLVRPAFVEATRTGESTGRLGHVLGELATHIEEDTGAQVKLLSKTVEPVVIAFMGGVVAFLALSLFLPLFDVSASAGGGAP